MPGWDLNCAVIGAVLAELSLLSRIDTDMESLLLVDRSETGNPRPGSDPQGNRGRNRFDGTRNTGSNGLLSTRESIIDLTLDRLVELKILHHHDGDFWTLAPAKPVHGRLRRRPGRYCRPVSSRRVSGECIFTDTIPDPKDIIVICLVDTCDVFRFIFELDDEAERRIELICKMDLIGRSIADAVEHTIASPLLRRSALNKQIPRVSPGYLLRNQHLRRGNLPALLGDPCKKNTGPVFEVRPAVRQTHDLPLRAEGPTAGRTGTGDCI